MPPDYTTPGVYVEEMPAYPSAIVAAETAIPAFIGYTQKADDQAVDDLHLQPRRIASMAEYERYFGAAQPEEAIQVTVTVTEVDGAAPRLKAKAALAENARSKHLMHYALQLFFAAGGMPVMSCRSAATSLGSAIPW